MGRPAASHSPMPPPTLTASKPFRFSHAATRADRPPPRHMTYSGSPSGRSSSRAGGRSARVAAWLNQNGYDAVNVAGGMGEWDAAGRPMVSDTGRPPYVV